ncbi:hypothetical protein ACQ4PT_025515 [Festuca glaucescens]
MAQVAAGNGSHVIDIDVVDDRTQRTDQPPLPDQSAAAAILYHVIDVKVDTTAAPPPELHECAVCMERLRWVAVGPCGHREVCSKCTVRIRSVDGNRLCCICRTPCPAVLVTRRSRTGGDGKLVYNDKVSSLELAANEGRVGKGNYWYHKASAAYFDDERQYNEAQRACSELQRAEVYSSHCDLPKEINLSCLVMAPGYAVAAGNGSHVIDIDADDSAERTDQPPLPDQLAAAANHCHVIDVVTVDTTAARPLELHECAVCMERLRWVAVGPCGHREVCSKCAVRIRSVDGNRLCCICRTPCPAVLVTRRSRTGDDGKLVYNDKVSSLELAAHEGRVGKGSYWYHKASAAYFDDERQYNEAQRVCSELQRAEVYSSHCGLPKEINLSYLVMAPGYAVAAGNGSHVIDIDVDGDRTQRTEQPPLPDQLAAAANHCHVIDVNVDTTAAPPPELHECAVCMERLRWVAVGPCGHREVCSKCTVRIRSVDGNRLCCICRTPCPTVVVTRRSRTGGDGKLVYNDKVSSLLALAADEGPVGNYWYHKVSATYFDNERQYNEAQRAGSELQRAERLSRLPPTLSLFGLTKVPTGSASRPLPERGRFLWARLDLGIMATGSVKAGSSKGAFDVNEMLKKLKLSEVECASVVMPKEDRGSLRDVKWMAAANLLTPKGLAKTR